MRDIGSGQYGTHLVPLIQAVLKTKGKVIEMGAGDWSTPVLHEIMKDRELITYDNNPNWLNNFTDLRTGNHKLILIKDWNEIQDDCSVILIDHAPAERRLVDIKKFQNKAEILIVHDFEKTRYYGYDKIPTFKYKQVYLRWTKQTALLSNTIKL